MHINEEALHAVFRPLNLKLLSAAVWTKDGGVLFVFVFLQCKSFFRLVSPEPCLKQSCVRSDSFSKNKINGDVYLLLVIMNLSLQKLFHF